MKGLFIYDIKTLKSMRCFLAIIAIVSIVTTVTNGFTFSVPYMTVFSAYSAINLFDNDKTMAYMFTLPVSRSIYAKEKYIFSIIFMFICSSALCAIGVIVCLVTQGAMPNPAQVLSIEAVALLGGYTVIIYMIPIICKWGNENGRAIASLLAIVSFFATVSVINSLGEEGIKWSLDFTTGITNMPAGALALIGALIIALLGLFSYGISSRIIKNKEF